MKVTQLKLNPNNPRVIKDDKFEKLVKSIQDFPKMMELRPIVVDSDMMVLGGNHRLKAIQQLGMKEIPDTWVKSAADLTPEEQKRFIVLIDYSLSPGEYYRLYLLPLMARSLKRALFGITAGNIRKIKQIKKI